MFQNLLQEEISEREEHLDEMRRSLQTTDAELQSCLAFLTDEAKQLQQLDLQLSGIGTSGMFAFLYPFL